MCLTCVLFCCIFIRSGDILKSKSVEVPISTILSETQFASSEIVSFFKHLQEASEKGTRSGLLAYTTLKDVLGHFAMAMKITIVMNKDKKYAPFSNGTVYHKEYSPIALAKLHEKPISDFLSASDEAFIRLVVLNAGSIGTCQLTSGLSQEILTWPLPSNKQRLTTQRHTSGDGVSQEVIDKYISLEKSVKEERIESNGLPAGNRVDMFDFSQAIALSTIMPEQPTESNVLPMFDENELNTLNVCDATSGPVDTLGLVVIV